MSQRAKRTFTSPLCPMHVRVRDCKQGRTTELSTADASSQRNERTRLRANAAVALSAVAFSGMLSGQLSAQNINNQANAQIAGAGGQVIYDLGPAPSNAPPPAPGFATGTLPSPVVQMQTGLPPQPANMQFVMGANGQMIPMQPGMKPVGFMVNGQMVNGHPGASQGLPQAVPQGVGGNYWAPPSAQSHNVTQFIQRVPAPQPPRTAPAPTPTTVYQSPLFNSEIKRVGNSAGVQTSILAPASFSQTNVGDIGVKAGQAELTASAQRFNQGANVRPDIIASTPWTNVPFQQVPGAQTSQVQTQVIQNQPVQMISAPVIQPTVQTTTSANVQNTVPVGQVAVPNDLQAASPIIPAQALPSDPANFQPVVAAPADPQDPELFRDLTLSSFDGSLVPDIPEIGDEDDFSVSRASSNALGRWSSGIAFNINGLGSTVADDLSLLNSTVGVSLDTGRRFGEHFAGRIKVTANTMDISAADMPSGWTNKAPTVGPFAGVPYRDVSGKSGSLHLLADYHPLKNGLRLTTGPGVWAVNIEEENDAVSFSENFFAPYVGFGYDRTLFSQSRWGVWADLGGYFPIGDEGLSGATDFGFTPDINLGIKRRW